MLEGEGSANQFWKFKPSFSYRTWGRQYRAHLPYMELPQGQKVGESYKLKATRPPSTLRKSNFPQEW